MYTRFLIFIFTFIYSLMAIVFFTVVSEGDVGDDLMSLMDPSNDDKGLVGDGDALLSDDWLEFQPEDSAVPPPEYAHVRIFKDIKL